MHIFDKSNDVPVKNVKMKDGFWSRYQKLVRDEVIPYQWKALNDKIEAAEPSHAMRNFRIAAGLEIGEFGGLFFQDSDLAKWIEAVGYSLEAYPDPELEALADEAVELIERAQQPDGYINTYFTLKAPEKRWLNLHECHELYCAGHMIEAAVAYYKGTGKRKLLDIMCRFADYIASVFGTEEGKIRGYCGHQEIELALVKLSAATGNKRYLELAEYFINERGQEPSYFTMEHEKRGNLSDWTKTKVPSPNLKYNQSHMPVREQSDAVGHAVRAVYMYTAMADIAAEAGDESLLEACRKLFKSIADRQMYITGGIGSTNHGEAFTFDYDLPNDTIYQETCASIGLIFFSHSMLKAEVDSVYADVLERALYNSVLSGMALDGKSFLYVNPLEVWPEACGGNPAKTHVKPVRQKWYGCACCPPNIARLLTSLGRYIYTVKGRAIYTHLYIGSETIIEMGESKVKLIQESNYPWDGNVLVKVNETDGGEYTIALRIPGWCRDAGIYINNEKADVRVEIGVGAESAAKAEMGWRAESAAKTEMGWRAESAARAEMGRRAESAAKAENGYVHITRKWQEGDILSLKMEMPVELVEANPRVRADAGKVAIQRGPMVYCLEEEDNDSNLSALSLLPNDGLLAEFNPELLGGIVVIRGKALRTQTDGWENALYRPYTVSNICQEIKAVPYCLWGNRKQGEMLVWMRVK